MHCRPGSFTLKLSKVPERFTVGASAFEDPKTSNLYKKIMGAEYTLPKFLSGQCKDLIRRILNTDPEHRFSVNDIRNHTWSL